jgi:hypothetical protein
VVLLDLFLVSSRTSTLFSIVIVLIYNPTNSVQGFLFLLHPLQHLSLLMYTTIAILMRVRWNLDVVLSFISFMTRDVEQFIMYRLVICASCLENRSLDCWLFKSLVFGVPHMFCLLIHCQIYSWQIFFSHSVGCLFSLLTISLVVQKLFSLTQSHLWSLVPIC